MPVYLFNFNDILNKIKGLLEQLSQSEPVEDPFNETFLQTQYANGTKKSINTQVKFIKNKDFARSFFDISESYFIIPNVNVEKPKNSGINSQI